MVLEPLEPITSMRMFKKYSGRTGESQGGKVLAISSKWFPLFPPFPKCTCSMVFSWECNVAKGLRIHGISFCLWHDLDHISKASVLVAHPVIHFYLPRRETSNRPFEFHLGVFWTPKSDFLQTLKGTPENCRKLVFDLQKTSKSKCIGSYFVLF